MGAPDPDTQGSREGLLALEAPPQRLGSLRPAWVLGCKGLTGVDNSLLQAQQLLNEPRVRLFPGSPGWRLSLSPLPSGGLALSDAAEKGEPIRGL